MSSRVLRDMYQRSIVVAAPSDLVAQMNTHQLVPQSGLANTTSEKQKPSVNRESKPKEEKSKPVPVVDVISLHEPNKPKLWYGRPVEKVDEEPINYTSDPVGDTYSRSFKTNLDWDPTR